MTTIAELYAIVGEDKVRQNLLKAADEMEKRGHAVGMIEAPDGQVCMFGSLAAGKGMRPTQVDHHNVREEQVLLEKYLCDTVADFVGVCDFNNRHTKDECIAAMRGAAVHDLAA